MIFQFSMFFLELSLNCPPWLAPVSADLGTALQGMWKPKISHVTEI